MAPQRRLHGLKNVVRHFDIATLRAEVHFLLLFLLLLAHLAAHIACVRVCVHRFFFLPEGVGGGERFGALFFFFFCWRFHIRNRNARQILLREGTR